MCAPCSPLDGPCQGGLAGIANEMLDRQLLKHLLQRVGSKSGRLRRRTRFSFS